MVNLENCLFGTSMNRMSQTKRRSIQHPKKRVLAKSRRSKHRMILTAQLGNCHALVSTSERREATYSVSLVRRLPAFLTLNLPKKRRSSSSTSKCLRGPNLMIRPVQLWYTKLWGRSQPCVVMVQMIVVLSNKQMQVYRYPRPRHPSHHHLLPRLQISAP